MVINTGYQHPNINPRDHRPLRKKRSYSIPLISLGSISTGGISPRITLSGRKPSSAPKRL